MYAHASHAEAIIPQTNLKGSLWILIGPTTKKCDLFMFEAEGERNQFEIIFWGVEGSESLLTQVISIKLKMSHSWTVYMSESQK